MPGTGGEREQRSGGLRRGHFVVQLLDAANGHPSWFTSDASLGLLENNTQAVPSPLPLTRDPGFPPTAAEPLVRQKAKPVTIATMSNFATGSCLGSAS